MQQSRRPSIWSPNDPVFYSEVCEITVGTVFLTPPMEPYGYSFPVPSSDKGGGKRIKVHGIGYLEENNYCNTEQFSVSGKIPPVKLSLKSQDSLSAESRSKPLDKVQKFLPPTVMIPERRLEHFVEQALTVQHEACVFHNLLDSSISLYSDPPCGKYHIPSETLQARKPFTNTKQRERWADDEHNRFLQALKLYGRAWQRIEEHIGTKTTVQIRSHAQKLFSKMARGSSGRGPTRTCGGIHESLRSGAVAVEPAISQESLGYILIIQNEQIVSKAGAKSPATREHSYLEQLQRYKQPTFSGTLAPSEAEAWFKSIKKTLDTMKCPDNQRVMLATYQLQGGADH
ncbi:hypothetical protein GIB67_014294 [Kingdonia uniflora]|uniref:Uncharacterized protein n=1 Tax=Kingdonia uniflora TaxID=39325 RepID=A0A7J7M227_9MAGN|nr:hypothetical protein GIB67_014294 [Kingdonia uniflora]